MNFYKPNTKVWAISPYYKDGEPTSYVSIFQAYVHEVIISQDTIIYCLRTPKGDTWGEDIDQKDVHEDFDVLVNKMKEIWIENSNVH